jgi:cell wall-associated NlpC family hydrolase
MTLEKRRNAYRDDLADIALQGQVKSAKFVRGKPVQIRATIANLVSRPAADADQVTQALMGETARVFETANGYAWLQLDEDAYVGYVQEGDVSETVIAPTHRVSVASTLLFPKADLKTQPVRYLPLNARVTVAGTEGKYAELATGGFVFSAHLVANGVVDTDYVRVAERFLNVPYLWGGKSFHGLDCSGLVQGALQACGARAPRDADMQEAETGDALRINDLDGLRRGDLIFWDGHVGIMKDGKTLLHANAHHMMVAEEPLHETIRRYEALGKPVTAMKRVQ